MNCPECDRTAGKYGKTRDGQQRYRCSECRKTFSNPKPLAGLATDPKKAAFALNLLLEGTSERVTSRLTGLDKNTILRIMVQAGEQCFQFLADTMQNVNATDIQCDELWSFVAKKERTAFFDGSGEGCGDAYCFTALDRNTKLLFCFHVGRRSGGRRQPIRGQSGVVLLGWNAAPRLDGRIQSVPHGDPFRVRKQRRSRNAD